MGPRSEDDDRDAQEVPGVAVDHTDLDDDDEIAEPNEPA